jgi:hypothetical protein
LQTFYTIDQQELLALHAEALRRLPRNQQFREVGGIQGGYFNLIAAGDAAFPVRIYSQQELDLYIPNF